MFDIKLGPIHPSGPGINIDLRTYPTPTSPIQRLEMMGMTDAQVEFVQKAVLGDNQAGTVTWLMYRSATIVVPEYIPRSVGQLLTTDIDLSKVAIHEVGAKEQKPCRLGADDLRPFAKAKPTQVVTMVKNHIQEQEETILACIGHTNNNRFLFYTYRGENAAYWLMHRVQKLAAHHQGFSVTNEPMIKYLE